MFKRYSILILSYQKVCLVWVFFTNTGTFELRKQFKKNEIIESKEVSKFNNLLQKWFFLVFATHY